MPSPLVILAGLLAVTIAGAGAGHWWHSARFHAAQVQHQRALAELRQQHATDRAAWETAREQALADQRRAADAARQQAVQHERARLESDRRAAALEARLAAIRRSNPDSCLVPADRVRLVADAARGALPADAAPGAPGQPADPVPGRPSGAAGGGDGSG